MLGEHSGQLGDVGVEVEQRRVLAEDLGLRRFRCRWQLRREQRRIVMNPRMS
jgi:hypothetical protein